MIKANWRNVAIYAAAITLITLVPYLVGWMQAGDDWVFNGFVFGVDDGNAYLGKMRIGAEGGWEFYIFYTPEDHDPAFGLYIPHIIIGHIVGFFVSADDPKLSEALAIAFQAWRMLGAFLMILAIYSFIAQFIRGKALRWLALILSTLAGGLGWVLILIGQSEWLGSLPIDFYVPENYSFLALLGLPHVASGRAAMLLGFVALFAALHRRQWRYAFLAGLLWNIVGLMVTFYLAIIYVLIGAWGLLLWIKTRHFPTQLTRFSLLALGLTAPQFLYNVWLFSTHDVFSQWSAQNDLPAPHPLHYVVGYIVLLGFAYIGAQWAWHKVDTEDGQKYALLLAWVGIMPILVYLPINVQRRLAEGVLIPLGILAAVGVRLSVGFLWKWTLTKPRNHRKRYQRTRFIMIALLLPTPFIIWLGASFGLLNPLCNKDLCPYRPTDQLAAFDWLHENSQPNEVVMGHYVTGNYLPIRTHLRPFYGHGPETLFYRDKDIWVKAFYQGELSETEKAELFSQYNIQYVFFGKLEKAIHNDPSVWNMGLDIIYDQNDYVIYGVKP